MWISSHGYISCWYKGKRSYEHIKVMEEFLGRLVKYVTLLGRKHDPRYAIIKKSGRDIKRDGKQEFCEQYKEYKANANRNPSEEEN